MVVTEILDADLNHWAPGARLFHAGTDYFVVDADLTDYPSSPMVTFIRRPTVLLPCDANGIATSSVPDHTFPPGTTAEEAIASLGHTLQGDS